MYNHYRYDNNVSTYYSNVVKIPNGYAALTFQKVSFFDQNGKHHDQLSFGWKKEEISGIASTSEGLFIINNNVVYRLTPYICQQIYDCSKDGIDCIDSTQDRLIIEHDMSNIRFYRNGKLNKLELCGKERFFHSKLYYYTIDDRNLFIYDQADFSLVKNIPTKLLNISDVKEVEQICYSKMNEELILIRCRDVGVFQDTGLFSYPRECKEFSGLESDYFHYLPEWDLILSVNGAYLHVFSNNCLFAKIPLNPDDPIDIFRMYVDQAIIFIESSEETYFFELNFLKLAILIASGLYFKSNLSAFLQHDLYDPRLLCLIYSFSGSRGHGYDVLQSNF